MALRAAFSPSRWRPIPGMTRSLATQLYGKKPGIDPLYDLVMDPQLARNEYPAEELDVQRAAEHTSLGAQFATKDIWDKYKNTVSGGPGNWTLARAINTTVMNPSSFVGCHVGDLESFDAFEDFFLVLL